VYQFFKIFIGENVFFYLADDRLLKLVSPGICCRTGPCPLFLQRATYAIVKSTSFGILSDEGFTTVATLRKSTQQVVAGNSLGMYAGKRSFF